MASTTSEAPLRTVSSVTSIRTAKSTESAAPAASIEPVAPTVIHITAFQEAIKFAEELHSLSQDLDQAQATLASIERLSGMDNFRLVDWDSLEATWALDHDGAHKQLDDEIRTLGPAFGAAKEGLEGALTLLDKSEHGIWWEQCKLKYSSMVCFFDYIPLGIEESDEDDDVAEQEHIKAKVSARDVTLDCNNKNEGADHEIIHRKPELETCDPWWSDEDDEDDKEDRELAENFSRESRKEVITRWAAKHGVKDEAEGKDEKEVESEAKDGTEDEAEKEHED